MGRLILDPKEKNLFMFPTCANTNKVTLIDYDSLTDKGEVDVALQGEMDRMFYELIPVIEKCQNKEQAAQVKAIVDSYQKGIESAFKDSPKKISHC